MTKTRKPESEAVMAARAEVAAIVEDLKSIKVRALAIGKRLKAAGRTAEPAGEMDGKPWTEEAWLASHLHSLFSDDEGDELRSVLAVARDLARGAKWTTVAGDAALRAK